MTFNPDEHFYTGRPQPDPPKKPAKKRKAAARKPKT